MDFIRKMLLEKRLELNIEFCSKFELQIWPVLEHGPEIKPAVSGDKQLDFRRVFAMRVFDHESVGTVILIRH